MQNALRIPLSRSRILAVLLVAAHGLALAVIWTSSLPIEQVLDALQAAEVPAGRIYSVADIVADPHYQARGMLLNAELPGGLTVKMPGIVPKLSQTPGAVNWQGPSLGQHTDEILGGMGLAEADIQRLKNAGVVQ